MRIINERNEYSANDNGEWSQGTKGSVVNTKNQGLGQRGSY
jgi:hypothetical protein